MVKERNTLSKSWKGQLKCKSQKKATAGNFRCLRSNSVLNTCTLAIYNINGSIKAEGRAQQRRQSNRTIHETPDESDY
jgi:hypothetical protein